MQEMVTSDLAVSAPTRLDAGSSKPGLSFEQQTCFGGGGIAGETHRVLPVEAVHIAGQPRECRVLACRVALLSRRLRGDV